MRQSSDRLERTGDPVGLTRKLHRRCVGQKLPLATDRRLDHAGKERPAEPDHHQPDTDRHDGQGDPVAPPGPSATTAPSTIREDQDAEQKVTGPADEQDAVQQTHEPNIEPRITVDDMAELMSDDTLQLIPRQSLDRPNRHADHGIARRVSGCERIDPCSRGRR